MDPHGSQGRLSGSLGPPKNRRSSSTRHFDGGLGVSSYVGHTDLNPQRITSAQDALLLSSAQGIAPLLNNPSSGPAAAVWCWPLFGGSEQLSAEPPPMPAGLVPEVTMADFMRYLRVIGDKHNRFSQLRQESANNQRRKISVTDITPGRLDIILVPRVIYVLADIMNH